jgi:hypothetical protein
VGGCVFILQIKTKRLNEELRSEREGGGLDLNLTFCFLGFTASWIFPIWLQVWIQWGPGQSLWQATWQARDPWSSYLERGGPLLWLQRAMFWALGNGSRSIIYLLETGASDLGVGSWNWQ